MEPVLAYSSAIFAIVIALTVASHQRRSLAYWTPACADCVRSTRTGSYQCCLPDERESLDTQSLSCRPCVMFAASAQRRVGPDEPGTNIPRRSRNHALSGQVHGPRLGDII